MFHTSCELITPGSINKFGVAGSCLFFSDNVYYMSSASHEAKIVYEAEFDCINASQLYDELIIELIADKFNVDKKRAEGLLDASELWFDHSSDDEAGWWLQGMRGECAVKMGFDGCKDRDEQGTVYIVPMFGRESELTLSEAA